MDKKFQDIHLIDNNKQELFVLRSVHIESIDMMSDNMIVIWVRPFDILQGTKAPSNAPIYLPKMKGCSLVID